MKKKLCHAVLINTRAIEFLFACENVEQFCVRLHVTLATVIYGAFQVWSDKLKSRKRDENFLLQT